MRVIGGIAKGKRLKFPKISKNRPIRPLTDQAKEALFNILAPRIEGSRFLDLFAGTGAVGIEALSRGAKVSFFVEQNRKIVEIIRENLGITGFSDNAEIYCLDVLRSIKLLDNNKADFDVIFIGAPYDSPILEETLKILSVTAVVSKEGVVIAEHRTSHKLNKSYNSLRIYKEARYGDTTLSFYKIDHDTVVAEAE